MIDQKTGHWGPPFAADIGAWWRRQPLDLMEVDVPFDSIGVKSEPHRGMCRIDKGIPVARRESARRQEHQTGELLVAS